MVFIATYNYIKNVYIASHIVTKWSTSKIACYSHHAWNGVVNIAWDDLYTRSIHITCGPFGDYSYSYTFLILCARTSMHDILLTSI